VNTKLIYYKKRCRIVIIESISSNKRRYNFVPVLNRRKITQTQTDAQFLYISYIVFIGLLLSTLYWFAAISKSTSPPTLASKLNVFYQITK